MQRVCGVAFVRLKTPQAPSSSYAELGDSLGDLHKFRAPNFHEKRQENADCTQIAGKKSYIMYKILPSKVSNSSLRRVFIHSAQALNNKDIDGF